MEKIPTIEMLRTTCPKLPFSIDYINHAWLTYQRAGEDGFFKPENRLGYCYKLIGERLKKIRPLPDNGKSNPATAREVGVV